MKQEFIRADSERVAARKLRIAAACLEQSIPLLMTVLCACFQFDSFGADPNDEQQLIGILQSSASPKDKDAACVRLKRVGTEQSIAALAALLADEQLSHSARYALESMPFPKAGAALVQALEPTSGLTRVGIINSLGVRREAQAVPALAKLLPVERTGNVASTDQQVSFAAAVALGEIATGAAISSLQAFATHTHSSGSLHNGAVDALLRGANRLLASGSESKALPVFRRIYENETSPAVRLAAYGGMIRSAPNKALPLLADGLAGTPGPAQTAALQLLRESNFPGTTSRLAKLLPKLSPSVQVGLIEALAQRGDAAAAPAIAALVRDGQEEVRLASLTAVGNLGDGSYVSLLAETAAAGDAQEQTAARSALARLHRGNVTEALLVLLPKARPGVQTEVARVLGERGDSSALPKLLELARRGSDSVRKAALQAVALLASEQQVAPLVQLVLDFKSEAARSEAAEALRVALQRIQSRDRHVDITPVVQGLSGRSIEGRIALLPICGSLVDPQLRASLRAAAADDNVQVRTAAIRALCDTRDSELLPDLTKVASSDSEENFRVLATAACVRLITEDSNKLSPVERLAPLKAVLAGKPSGAQKRMVLAGLAEIPDRHALALSEELLNEAPVQAEASRAVIKIASTLPGADDEATTALKKILTATTDANTRQAAEAALKTIHARTEFITSWQVAGPYRQAAKNYADLFDIAFPPEVAMSERGALNLGENQSETPPKNSASAKWRMLPAAADPARPGILDLLKPLGGEQCVAYVRTRIHSKQSQAARLEIGSDDGLKVWLNGKLVHANNVARPLEKDSDKVNVNLNEGENDLLLKITQNNLGWEFCVRVVQPDGSHLEGVHVAVTP